jgi:competence protein ComEC
MKQVLSGSGARLLLLIFIALLCKEMFDFKSNQTFVLPIVLLCILIVSLFKWQYKDLLIGPLLILFLVLYFSQENLELFRSFDLYHENLDVFRSKIKSRLNNLALTNEAISLSLNLSIADRSLMTKNVKESFVAIGCAHLIAVSGMHLGVVYLLGNHLLKLLPFNRIAKSLLLGVSILIYASLTGFPVSVIRALCMILLLILTSALNEKKDTYQVLFLTAAIMLLIAPKLITHWGFQFSFLGVLGIIIGFEQVYISVHKNKIIRFLINFILVSIYAQIMIAPILIYHVNEFPLVFLVSGFILTPLIYLIMMNSFIILTTGFSFFVSAQNYLVELVLWFNMKIGQIPYSKWSFANVSELELFIQYLIIFSLIELLRKPNIFIVLLLLSEIFFLIKISLSCYFPF